MREILESREAFDLDSPLNEADLQLMAQVGTAPGRVHASAAAPASAVLVKDLEEDDRAAVSEKPSETTDDYNAAYVHWTKCQALLALRGFEEGWVALWELVIDPYLTMRRNENRQYRGDDPNKAFSLRLHEQAAEDFIKHIMVSVDAAAEVEKPSLE